MGLTSIPVFHCVSVFLDLGVIISIRRTAGKPGVRWQASDVQDIFVLRVSSLAMIFAARWRVLLGWRTWQITSILLHRSR
jgi:hypothetical protein